MPQHRHQCFVSVLSQHLLPVREFILLFGSNLCLCVEQSLHTTDPDLYNVAWCEHFSPLWCEKYMLSLKCQRIIFLLNLEEKKAAITNPADFSNK